MPRPTSGRYRAAYANARDAARWFPALVAEAAALHRRTTDQVLSPSRDAWTVDARHVVAWVLRSADMSYPTIAAFLQRDHSSIMHAVRRVENTPDLLIQAFSLSQKYVPDAAPRPRKVATR